MPVSSAPSPTRSKRSSTISKRSIHSTSPQSPIQALRFIDQLDFYLWQSSGNESVVLDSILPTTLHTESQVAWYRKLVSSAAPRKLTLSDIRRALLKDFGVDSKTTRKVLTRYNDEDYLRSQSFKLVMNYIDEIEGLKERIEKEDTAKILARWKRVLAKTEAKNAAAIREKEKEVAGLKRTVLELETAVRGLTSILGFPEEERGTLTERAFERYQEEVGDAAERFRAQLAIGGTVSRINFRARS